VTSTLLVVHHIRSPYMREISRSDILEADGYVLGSPASLGYMSGALKHYSAGYPAKSDEASHCRVC